MLYLSKSEDANGMVGITDTDDGVEEFIRSSELRRLCDSLKLNVGGFNISKLVALSCPVFGDASNLMSGDNDNDVGCDGEDAVGDDGEYDDDPYPFGLPYWTAQNSIDG